MKWVDGENGRKEAWQEQAGRMGAAAATFIEMFDVMLPLRSGSTVPGAKDTMALNMYRMGESRVAELYLNRPYRNVRTR